MNLKVTVILASVLAVMSSCGVSKSKVADQIKAEWSIEEVYGKSTETAQNPAVIGFRSGSKVNGNASVNTFFGSYKLSGSSIKFDNIGMTRMMGASMDIDDAVLRALRNAAYIEIEGDSATIKDENGEDIMRMKRK